jgi:hypothetical protein
MSDPFKAAHTVALLGALCLAGCATTGMKSSHWEALRSGRKVMLLLRVTVEADAKPQEPFAYDLGDDNVGLGVGDFRTGGDVIPLTSPGFLSEESRKAGWAFLLLDPGVHTLALLGPRRSGILEWNEAWRHAPQWVVDLPSGAHLVYAGTFHLRVPPKWRTWGGTPNISLRDESDLAVRVASEALMGLGPPTLVPLRPRGKEPLRFRAPVESPNR